jgi:protein-disulfide isomerase
MEKISLQASIANAIMSQDDSAASPIYPSRIGYHMSRRLQDACLIILTVLLVAFLWRANNRIAALEVAQKSRPASPVVAPRPTDATLKNDVAGVGRDDAPYTIVQFTDFQCPFCQKFAAETMPLLHKNYIATGKVRLVVRHFPLAGHSNATTFALASRCALRSADRGYAFDMALYRSAGGKADSAVAAASAAAGMDNRDIQACVASGREKEGVELDKKLATSVGVRGTPAFVIGKTGSSITGRMVYGAIPTENYVATLDSVISGKIKPR